MTARKYFLGIDAGQTVVKAVIHDDKLARLSLARRQSPMSSNEPRRLERSQDDLWKAASGAIAEALQIADIDPKEIAGIGITGHGDGLHLVDRNGGAVGPAIMAVDSRAFAEMEEIHQNEARSNRILVASGQVPFLGSPGVLLKWTQRHEPQRLEDAHAFLFCKDVLRLRLTGEIATDYSDASASFLNADLAKWDESVLADYGLSGLESLFPRLISSAEIAGYVTAAAAAETGLKEGTPVVGGVHDVHASAIGMGALSENTLTLIAGSFTINAVTTRESHTDARWQSRLSVVTDLRMAMSTSATASTTLEWFLRLVGATDPARRDQLFAEAADIPPGESLPTVLPFFYASPFGESPSGTFAGMRGWHTTAHMLKAVLEGIVSMHVWHTSALADAFSWHRPVRLGGGIANSGLYSQMVADALDSETVVVSNDETGAFGAAALAGVGVGHFSSLRDVESLVNVSSTKLPTAALRGYWDERRESGEILTENLTPWWDASR